MENITLLEAVVTIVFTIVGSVAGGLMYMTGQLNKLSKQIADIDKRLVRIETIIEMKRWHSQDAAIPDEHK